MSNLTAVAYYAGIPPNNNNMEKPQILDYFCQGVVASGDTAVAHRDLTTLDCDVALIQGFVHEHGKSAPHLQLRQNAVALQKKNQRRSLIVDSSLFLYSNKTNPLHYLRYSFDGVFPTTGFYFDRDIDPSRWSQISKDLGISLKPWRLQGNHILICLQRNGGWSMRGLDVIQWMNSIILEIRKYSNRPIVVRAHPGDKKIGGHLKINHKSVSLSTGVDLREDLKNAWATVVYNSSPSVASIIEGIPSFLTDPQPQHSQSVAVANTDISRIEDPVMVDRQAWVERLSMCHWKFDELKSGEAWKFFRKYV
jgi:hypothetical protein